MIKTKWDNHHTPLRRRRDGSIIHIPKAYHDKSVRAMWVSNVLNIDLPTTEDFEAYRSAIQQLFDTCERFRINTLFFQVRTTNDAFYASRLNPYSRYLTGEEGREPPIDVMAWLIEASHARGIAFHAWCNPYRISAKAEPSIEAYLDTCASSNYARSHPDDIVLDTRGQLILNPAHETVKQHIVDSMVEIVEQYQVDGIHFDDYFYPYAGLDSAHDDSAAYQARSDKSLSLGDFRRYHVTQVVERVKIGIKKVRPDIQFGISPFGIWMNQDNHPQGSPTDRRCSQSYDNQYADTVDWVKRGLVDYIVPQLYWPFDHPLAPFADLADWWIRLCENADVDLYIGHGAYRLGTEAAYLNPDEIVHQVRYAGANNTVKGHVFFTYHTFIDSSKPKAGIEQLRLLLNNEEANT